MNHSIAHRILLPITVAALTLGTLAACNPSPGSGTVVREGVGIRDYYTMRSVTGDLQTRDVKPEPRPREAITGDDYFQVKLEHIYMGDALGRDVGNVAIISQIEGILPKGTTCNEIDVSDLEFDLNQRERATHEASASCAYKHVVAVNPVFSDGHVTFDSAFITPPFRMGRSEVGLRFIIAQLNDVELARALVKWSQEQLNNLSDWGLAELEMTKWQAKLVDIGFTVANYILDYASKPDYVFEFETDFVPIETVGGVTTPQNIFMGGDFVIAGFPRATMDELASMDDAAAARATDRSGALVMSDKLLFDSGRLYWKSNRKEFRDAPYVVFKVVRQSRFAGDLPVNLASLDREITRGSAPEKVMKQARGAVLDLQDGGVVNETEGRYLLDLFEWFAAARQLEAQLDDMASDPSPDLKKAPLQVQSLPPGMAPDVAALADLAEARSLMRTLGDRIYANYARSPGMWQSECTAIRDVTQDIAQSYQQLAPRALQAHRELAVQRNQLQTRTDRTAAEDERLLALKDAESWANRLAQDMKDELEIPACPALRE